LSGAQTAVHASSIAALRCNSNVIVAVHQTGAHMGELHGIPVFCERIQTDLCLATPRREDPAWMVQSRFVAFIAILVIGLQSSVGAFAAASPLTSMAAPSTSRMHV
jgi:hypothetical protein